MNSDTSNPTHGYVQRWHEYIKAPSAEGLGALLADDVVFHSPVVHTPQKGKAITSTYLTAADEVLMSDSFHYVREIVGDLEVMLEFNVEIDGIIIDGIDLITFNEQGLITEFKVMIRPLKAINLVHGMMASQLKKMQG